MSTASSTTGTHPVMINGLCRAKGRATVGYAAQGQ
jgi:hypothetical protein